MTVSIWTADEDKTLKDAVPTDGEKNWVAISAQVRGRTRTQCYSRWHNTLKPSSVDPTTARAGKWKADEYTKLKAAVQKHGGKNWVAIAALVLGRTKRQCRKRWHDVLVSNIDQATARMGLWTADEDKKLKNAVRAHGGKNWKAIAALVPGRTKRQCRERWHDV
jgi:myb proto-oncogene protein